MHEPVVKVRVYSSDMSQPIESRPNLELAPGHQEDLEKIGILEKGELSIQPAELLKRAKEQKRIDQVISIVSQELNNTTMTNLGIAKYTLMGIEESLMEYKVENLNQIIADLAVVQSIYDKVNEQSPLLEHAFDILREARVKDTTLPEVTSELKFYFDTLPADLVALKELTHEIQLEVDRVVEMISNLLGNQTD